MGNCRSKAGELQCTCLESENLCFEKEWLEVEIKTRCKKSKKEGFNSVPMEMIESLKGKKRKCEPLKSEL